MAHQVSRWEIATGDLPGIRSFYRELFGWRVTSPDPDRYSIVDGGDGIAGLMFQADRGVPPFVTIYVEVDDVDEHLALVEKLGGTIYVPATASPIPGEKLFGVFGDPEGNIVGVCQRG